MDHVFVDFENVPSVDLSLIANKSVHVTLLIGEKQRRLDLMLVRQIHEHAAKVTLIEVGASGRNALDLVLAWHLGHTAERHPGEQFYIVSRDKDFDPLLSHLHARGLKIGRVDSFAELPMLDPRPSAKHPPAPRRTAVSNRPTPPIVKITPAPVLDDRLAKLIDRLQHKPKARPVRRNTLLSHINGFYGNQLSEGELDNIVATLQQRGIVRVDANDRVEYPLAAAGTD